jgi:tetratricopeptide (TPR) repeat protein
VEQGHISKAQLAFHRGLARHDPDDLRSAVAMYEQLRGKPESLDGEMYTCWAVGLHVLGKYQEAVDVIQSAQKQLDKTNPQDEQWLKLAECYLSKKDPQTALDWFEQHGFQRIINFTQRLEFT